VDRVITEKPSGVGTWYVIVVSPRLAWVSIRLV
jgi:hypothetical protein